jgi:hypothetical protein
MNYQHQNFLNHFKSFLQFNYGSAIPNNNHQVESHKDQDQNTSRNEEADADISNKASSSSTSLLHGEGHKPKDINFDEVKVFENNEIILYVKKAFQQRQKRFRLQDSLFHIKVKVKKNVKIPLLRELADVLQEAFTFILRHIQTFFPKEDHNIGYLTLYQEPMINGLNTGIAILISIVENEVKCKNTMTPKSNYKYSQTRL